MEGTSAEVGAVISDLETEYERSQKFLADLCRSLESRGVMKRPGARDSLEDKSPFVTKESDGPVAVSSQNTAASIPFAAVKHCRDDSELSNCSGISTSIPRLPEPNGDSNRSPSTNYSLGIGSNNDYKHQRRGDVPPLSMSSSPMRNRTSARAGRKPSNVSSSCPSMDPSQDDSIDRARHSGSYLDFGPPQSRSSGLGFGDAPPLSQLLVPPQPPVGNVRRSSLDFVPAAQSHTRKWCDNSLLAAQHQHQQQQALLPSSSSSQQQPSSYELGGHRSLAPSRRGSLEVIGCPRTAAAATGPSSGSTNNYHDNSSNSNCNNNSNNNNHSHSCSGAAPAGASAVTTINTTNTNNNGVGNGSGGGMSVVGGSSILSRSSCPLSRRCSLAQPAHSPTRSHSQQQMPQMPQTQPQLQPRQSQPGVSPIHLKAPSYLSLHSFEPLQLQLQLLQHQSLSLQLDSPGATTTTSGGGGGGGRSAPLAIVRSPVSRRATESGALPGPSTHGSPSGSVSGGLSCPLPPLLPTTSSVPASLSLNITSPGSRGTSTARDPGGGGGIPSPIPSPGPSPGTSALVAAFRRGSSNGALLPSAASGPQEPPWSPAETQPRSGRFSRCGQADTGAAATVGANAAASSPTLLPSASAVSAAAAALLHHAASGRDRRALSSGELPERFVPRTAFAGLTGGGGGSSGGSPLSRHESSGGGGGGGYGSPMMSRRGSELGAAADAHAPRGAGAAAAAAAAVAPDLPWHHSHQQQQQQQNMHYHHQAQGQTPATRLSAGLGLRPENRTRLGPAGAAGSQR
ncbi:hypothetical protein PLESTB_001435200 [Pleodorina starrii]|uniref:Uncharacterized protein n=1 Tax=Pleodorina starrii TaxID=330485 RepID=A0A9W6BWG9_9CHLO|nr:hypothetical protein PLESTB_001435200 [Pleodorina starrii]GLC67615.1 hypothetical protein PLESTF_000583200 [Pleodorina starrii]